MTVYVNPRQMVQLISIAIVVCMVNIWHCSVLLGDCVLNHPQTFLIKIAVHLILDYNLIFPTSLCSTVPGVIMLSDSVLSNAGQSSVSDAEACVKSRKKSSLCSPLGCWLSNSLKIQSHFNSGNRDFTDIDGRRASCLKNKSSMLIEASLGFGCLFSKVIDMPSLVFDTRHKNVIFESRPGSHNDHFFKEVITINFQGSRNVRVVWGNISLSAINSHAKTWSMADQLQVSQQALGENQHFW